MRPFPPRVMSNNNIPIITPYFIGYHRGIDGNLRPMKQTKNSTSVDTIKCLRSPTYNATPIVSITERYDMAPVSTSKTMTLPPSKMKVKTSKKFVKINTSTY